MKKTSPSTTVGPWADEIAPILEDRCRLWLLSRFFRLLLLPVALLLRRTEDADVLGRDSARDPLSPVT